MILKRALLATAIVAAVGFAACGDDDSDATPTPTQAAATSAASPAGSPAATSAAASPSAATAGKLGLDSSFGTAGILAAPMSTSANDRFMAVATGSDGSIYAAGFTTLNGDQAMAVAKFNASGAPDRTFGENGVAVANVAAGGKTAELARAIAIQSNGKVIVGGPVEHDVEATGDLARDTDVAVVRFETNGKLDTTFGRGGIAKIDFGAGRITTGTTFVGDTSWGLGTLPGDKVVVFGSRLSTAAADRTDTDFVLAGLTSAGVLDTAFGTAGLLSLDVSETSDNPRNLLVQPDGKIVGSGYATIDGVVQPVLIRTSATGQLDTSFGSGGVATAKVLAGVAEAYAIGLQGSDYVLSGYGRGADTGEKVDMIAYRFKANGAWDESFGTNGVYRLDLAKEDDRSRNMTVLPDGRIVLVGSGKMNATNIDGMVHLLSKDGAPVTSFGTNGYVLSDLGGPADAWYGVALSADKKTVILAGYKGVDTTSGGNDDAVLARVII